MASHLDEADNDYAGALTEFRRGVRIATSLGSKWEIAFGLGGIGRMLALTGDHTGAAIVLGAAEELREEVGMRPSGPRAEALDRAVAEIRRELGDAQLNRLGADGKTKSLDEVVAIATEEQLAERPT